MISPHVYTVEGIILKRRNVGEADRIITVFTKQYGKMRLLAKGIRRIISRRAGHLEVFSHVTLTLHKGRSLDLISEASAIRSGLLFDTDDVRLGFAYCMCELVDQLLADHQEHEDIFFLLRDSLNELLASNSQEVYQKLLGRFVHEMLWKLGFLQSSRLLTTEQMQPFIEEITERRLRAWPHLTVHRASA